MCSAPMAKTGMGPVSEIESYKVGLKNKAVFQKIFFRLAALIENQLIKVDLEHL